MNFPNFDADNKSLLKKYLTPAIYAKLVSKKTALGYTLAQAINSGLMNADSNIGVYAGDEESYELFAELFDPIIKDYHGFEKTSRHQSNLNVEELDIQNPDPKGQYVLSTRIRVGRNLKDVPLGSLISDKARKEIANSISSTLLELTGDLKGNYYALDNMTESERKEMVNDHFLFKEGDRFLEAAGLNRNWPKDRGIYFNKAKNFLVWINEEDQMRIISMQKGADIKGVFQRLVTALNHLEQKLDFAFSDRLGYISSCPTNLGTAMRASVHISLPKLGMLPAQMEQITNKHHLQIRGLHGEHSDNQGVIFDISNRRRLGITEIQAVKDLYDGVKHLIEAEQLLESE